MNHRLQKLVSIYRGKGIGAATSFLVEDVYFRLLASLTFPGRRSVEIETAGAGRNPFKEFVDEMNGRVAKGARVLEVGSRAVSGVTVRSDFVPGVEYVGMDVHAGPNVDITGDAHVLGEMFAPESFDGVFSRSVFEHLLMPWVVVLETNKILKVDGLTMIFTHPTWPPHELPWDFWSFRKTHFGRFSTRPLGSRF